VTVSLSGRSLNPAWNCRWHWQTPQASDQTPQAVGISD
jgi:hypothetical protein